MIAYIRRILTQRLKTSPARRLPARRAVLRVADLEDRCTPATFTVLNTGDNGGVNPAVGAGTGTLRQAIVDSNSAAGGDVITINLGGTQTIGLVAALPQITGDLAITNQSGTAANLTITRSSGVFGIFSVGVGVTNFALNNLSVTNGLSTTTNGAAINVTGVAALTILNCVVSGNTTSVAAQSLGGAIFNGGSGSITISGSTFANNSSANAGAGGFGGAIFNLAGSPVTITGSTFTNNTSFNSGGVLYQNGSGAITITGSTITGNSGNGGGVLLGGSTAPVTVTNSTISNNAAVNGGGGAMLFLFSTSLTLRDSTISGNTATGPGGAIFFSNANGGGGGVNMSGSTFSGNQSGSYGGGLTFFGPVSPFGFAIVNSTFFNNTATGPGGGIALSGFTGTTRFQNSTITGNTAGAPGGGGIAAAGAGAVVITNSIVAGNNNAAAPDITTLGTPTVDVNFSAIGSLAGFTPTGTSANNLIGATLLLGPLQNNGGPTQTMLPAAGSPLIDAGSNALIPTGVTTDQRGAAFARDFSTNAPDVVDIGAVEVQPPATTVVSINRVTTSPTNAGSVSWTVTFGAPVHNLTAANFALIAAGVTGATITSVTPVGTPSTTFTVTASTGTGDGTLGLNLTNAASIRPVVTTATPFVGQVYTIDKTAPTVTSINRAAANPTNAPSLTFTVTFSESVGGVDGTDFALATAGVVGASITSVSPAGPTNVYTVTVATGTANPGTIGLDLVDDDSITDAATNRLGGTGVGNGNFTGQVYNVDTVAPTVTINQAGGQLDPTNVASVNFTITFSEPATGFTAAGVVLTYTGPGVLTGTLTGGPTTYNLNVTGFTAGTQGTLTATVNANAARDFIGATPLNGNTASTSTDNAVVFDQVRPTVTIDQAAGQADPTSSLPILFTVVFGEPVVGFDPSDVVLTGVGVGPVTITPVSPTTYTVGVPNVTAVGTVTATVSASGVTDLAGNTNTASTSGDNSVTFFVANPTVTINQGAAQADPASGASVTFDVVFNQPVMGFDTADITLSGSLPGVTGLGTAITPVGPPVVPGFFTAYTLTVTGMAAGTQGTIIATVNGGAATGQFANVSVASTSTDNSVTFDGIAPAVTIDQGAAQADPTNGATVVYDIVFSEPVTGLTAADVTVSYTGPGTITPTLTGSGTTYQLSLSGMTAGTQGTFTLTIPAAAANDLAGNPSLASTSTDNTVTFDNVRPTVTIVRGATQVDPTNGTSISYDVVFGEPVTGFDGTRVVLSGTLPGAGALAKLVTPVGPPAVPGYFTTYTVTVTGMINGTQGTVTANIPAGGGTDLATNTSLAAAATATVVYDSVKPTVTINQAGTQADPTNGTISYAVVFNEAVTGFDSADVALNLTGTLFGLTPTVGISGSGANYTVTVSGFPAEVQGSVTASVVFGGVVDLATNPNTFSTSTDATVGFDSVRPTVTINQGATQADPTPLPTIKFDVVFSEPVTGFTAADVRLSLGGTIAGATPTVTVAGSGTTYTVTVGGLPLGGVGNVTADVLDGGTLDLVGNPSTASVSTDNTVRYDNERPQFTIKQAVGQNDPTGGSGIVFDVVFSEPVTGFTSADVTLGGTLPGVNTLTAVVAGIGDTYTITVFGMQAGTQGTVVANVSSGVAVDVAGNTNDAPTTADNTVTFDGILPSVTITRDASQPDITSVFPVLFDVTFSEPVTGFDAADVDLTGSSGGPPLTATVTGSGTTYTVAVTGPVPSTRTIVATVFPGGAFDAAGNPDNLAPLATNNTVLYDSVRPSVTVNRAAATGTGVTNDTPIFTVVFSEPVTGFTAADVSFAGTTTGGAPTAVVSGSGATYTVTVTGVSGVGNVVASIPGVGAAVDVAGNASLPSTSTNNVVPFDAVTPSVTINRAAPQADPAIAGPILFTVVFTEPVTGFTAADVSLSGSTTGGALTATVTPTGPTTFTVAVSGMASPGDVVVTVPEGAAADPAGNASGASTSTDNSVVFNNVLPTVTINQAAGQADPTTSGDVAFTVVFSKAVVGFGPASVSLEGTTVGGALSVAVSGSGATYTVTVSGMDGKGVVVASIPGGVVTDTLGNPNVASTSSDHTVRFDNQPPTVTVEKAVGQADPARGTAPIVFDIVFSEPVFGLTASDISLAGTTAAGAVVTGLTGAGTTYTVSVTGMTATGDVVVSIPAGAVNDGAGNLNTASTGADNVVAFDATAPTVVVGQAPGQADPASGAPIAFTVTFSVPVTGFDALDVSLAGSTAGGTLAASVTGSGLAYTVSVSGMTTAGDVLVTIPAGAAADGFGNTSLVSTSTDNRVTFQPASPPPPTATVAPPPGTPNPVPGGPVVVTVVFTTPVTGFDATDVNLGGSTTGGVLVAAVTGSGDTYTVTVTGAASPGDVVISVPAGAAADAGGNATAAVPPVTVGFRGGTTADQPDMYAVGAGNGGGARVDVFDSTGTRRYSATPYPVFSGGVRVAVADVTGDGIPDYVAGTGPGSPTAVTVIDGASLQTVFTYQPFEPTFLGGVFVAAGDLTGDGKPDLIITPDEGGGPRVIVLKGGAGSFPMVASFFGINDPAFRGGARAAAGDINADGVDDLAVAAGFQGGPRVSVYDGKSLAAGRQVNLFGDLFIFDGADAVTLRNGAFIGLGDVNGDGFADLIGGGGPGGGPRVFALSGKDLLTKPAPLAAVVANFFAGPAGNRGGVPLAMKDLDGDPFADIVTGSGPGAGTRVRAFKGSTLGTANPQQITAFDAFSGLDTGVYVG